MYAKLTQLPNIGRVLADRLNAAGIRSVEDLVATGSCEAWKLVRNIYPEACLDTLFALEGAVQGIRWHQLAPGRKEELTHFFREQSGQ